jgi:UDP-glucose 4-epimerase
MLSGKKILITGGTGSFGRFILKRILKLDVEEIRVFSRDEKKQYDMRLEFAAAKNLKFFIGDVRDFEALRHACEGVDIIYQAAALKQVPNCEYFPMEAIKTNIMGAQNVVQAALETKADIVVAVSTDKAVKPVNVMGMTKALQERILIQANYAPANDHTRFVCVRYGNVAHSRGSVIPYFKKLLLQGKTIPITDPEMTRFLLTLDDAIDLVLYATEHGEGGEVFVKKAPSAHITTLAEILAEKYAPKGYETKVIGIFPGEKIHEILISEEEMVRSEEREEYFVVYPPQRHTRLTGSHKEYCSRDHVADKEDIRTLLEKSERLLQQDSYEEGYF